MHFADFTCERIPTNGTVLNVLHGGTGPATRCTWS